MFSASKTKQAVSGALALTKSLRLRSSASAYLSRTPSSATNRKTWTWSGWIKFGRLTGYSYIFGATSDAFANNFFLIQINNSASTMALIDYNSAYSLQLIPSQVFADPSAWYHIVFAMDTTQATASNRAKLYVNGNQVTSFTTATYPALNANTNVNNNILHTHGYSSYGMDGYLAEVNFIDGQQLTPSSFGVTDATTGVWQPKAYSGSYGTNGFHLTFANTTSTTTLGYDTSGNSNNWTTNNISLTAGSTYDSMNDVPTLTSTTASNYAVLNPSVNVSAQPPTNSNGNLTSTANGNASQGSSPLSSMAVSSGKWYCEFSYAVSAVSGAGFGIVATSFNPNATADSFFYYGAIGFAYLTSGQKATSNTASSYGSSYTTGDVIGIALDLTAGTLTFYKNGTSQGTAYSGLSGTFYFAGYFYSNSVINANFGQQPWAYTPPSGYVALNTYNLPTPTIVQGNQYMDVVLRNGGAPSGGTYSTNVNMSNGAFLWNKPRNQASSNYLVDTNRGLTKFLQTNTTNAETTQTGWYTSFGNGTYSTGSTDWGSTVSLVDWIWASGSNTTNTNGSITSTVSASTTAGFSVVTYTGTGTAGTIGHGLGVAPSMIIVKSRSASGDWPVYHSSVGNGSYTKINTSAASASSSTVWNATSPTSSVFSVGINTDSNTVTVTYVAYCFAPVTGFSAFGSYVGNGSTSGPFIYTGFRPKYIMYKSSTRVCDWGIVDTSRNPYNSVGGYLSADTAVSEGTYTMLNILSNGWQIIWADSSANTSGETYIYMAFAENPFKYANAR